MTHAVGVLLAGGKGTRLWPLSTASSPKQFLTIAGQPTCLFLHTVERVMPVCDSLVIVTTKDYCSLISSLLSSCPLPFTILVEPEGRNTAAALALAACYAAHHFGDDSVMWCIPTDHYVDDSEALCRAANSLIMHTQPESIGVFGITPYCHNSNYGHIVCGELQDHAIYHAASFVEKPPEDVIKHISTTSLVVWNSGMFIFTCGSFLSLLGQYQPAITDAASATFAQRSCDGSVYHFPSDYYYHSPSISIDYALMEYCADRLRVCLLDSQVGWTDIGSWQGLWNVSQKDSDGSVYYPIEEMVDFSFVVQDDVAVWLDAQGKRLVIQPKSVYEENSCLV